MDNHARQLWLDALRSGDYRQGEGLLHYVTPEGEHKFCCLGVLCEVAIADGVNLLRSSRERISYDGAVTALPMQVAEWAGLNDTDPVVNGNRLSAWNDGTGDHTRGVLKAHSFIEIADLIEEHL